MNTTTDAAEILESQECKLAVGPFARQSGWFSCQTLVKDEFAVALNRKHHCVGLKPLPLADFVSIPHIEITSAPYTTDFVDAALAWK